MIFRRQKTGGSVLRDDARIGIESHRESYIDSSCDSSDCGDSLALTRVDDLTIIYEDGLNRVSPGPPLVYSTRNRDKQVFSRALKRDRAPPAQMCFCPLGLAHFAHLKWPTLSY